VTERCSLDDIPCGQAEVLGAKEDKREGPSSIVWPESTVGYCWTGVSYAMLCSYPMRRSPAASQDMLPHAPGTRGPAMSAGALYVARCLLLGEICSFWLRTTAWGLPRCGRRVLEG